jgi:nitrite reductase/ring-hydroxylating ferredoxin subunit
MLNKGWFQLAFTRDLNQSINPVQFGDKKLIAVKIEDEWRIYDAWCPHRGAHLAYGGCLKGNKIQCSFHGLLIGLGNDSKQSLTSEQTSSFSLKQYRTIDLGGILFFELGEGKSCGFLKQAKVLIDDFCLVPGFQTQVNVPHSMVIENAFDCAHFHSVHNIVNHPDFEICDSESEEFKVSGEFVVPKSPWHINANNDSNQTLLFTATAFSSGIVITSMDGSDPYCVITCSTPGEHGTSNVFLSIAVPTTKSSDVDPVLCKYLLKKSYEGLQPDIKIWENMNTEHQPIFIDRDKCVQEFQKFSKGFYE